MITATDQEFIVHHFPFWEHLSTTEQRALLSGISPVHYSAQYALRTGDRSCIGIILVKTGALRVYLLSPEGREVTLFRITAGNVCVLSASCVLDAIAFDVCIATEAETDVLIADPHIFRTLTESNVYVKEYGYETATKRFTEVMWTMQQILFMKFDQRLALFLVKQIEQHAATLPGNRIISLTHEQIAADTGSAREVVTRMLRYFSDEGIVTVARGTITVIDEKRLRAIASQR